MAPPNATSSDQFAERPLRPIWPDLKETPSTAAVANPNLFNCSQCGRVNDRSSGSQYCINCGRDFDLPPGPIQPPQGWVPEGATTRFGTDEDYADAHHSTRSLEAMDLERQARREASGTLIFLGVIHLLAALIMPPLAKAVGLPGDPVSLGISLFFTCMVFFGLAWWARTEALMASILGIVIYVVLWVIDLSLNVDLIKKQGSNLPMYGIGIKLVIIMSLGRAAQKAYRAQSMP
jgi:hypothetical protein